MDSKQSSARPRGEKEWEYLADRGGAYAGHQRIAGARSTRFQSPANRRVAAGSMRLWATGYSQSSVVPLFMQNLFSLTFFLQHKIPVYKKQGIVWVPIVRDEGDGWVHRRKFTRPTARVLCDLSMPLSCSRLPGLLTLKASNFVLHKNFAHFLEKGLLLPSRLLYFCSFISYKKNLDCGTLIWPKLTSPCYFIPMKPW
jgi:hypothetical protein